MKFTNLVRVDLVTIAGNVSQEYVCFPMQEDNRYYNALIASKTPIPEFIPPKEEEK